MTKARDLANLISGGFTEADIPNLSASKITSGTFADARIAASNVSQHAQSFDDNKIINDISTLGLRVHTQENLNASNTNSASFDVFQDSSGITNLTNTQRNSLEYVASVSEGTATAYPMFTGVNSITAKLVTGNSITSAWNGTYQDIVNSGDTRFVDPETARTAGSRGGYPTYWNSFGTSSFITFDLGQSLKFSSKMAIGKQDTYGDVKDIRIQYSADDNTYTDLDMTGVTRLSNHSNPNYSKDVNITDSGEGNRTAGYVRLTQIYTSSSNYGTGYAILQGIPSFNARYIKIFVLTNWSGTANNNAGFGIFQPYYIPQTTNATGSFEGATITAGASTSSMGAVITYQDNAGTNTLNTDIILKLSADNGSNYSTATLTALPDFATGIKMAKVNDLTISNAGTQLKYKIEFANQSESKNARIRGVSLQY